MPRKAIILKVKCLTFEEDHGRRQTRGGRPARGANHYQRHIEQPTPGAAYPNFESPAMDSRLIGLKLKTGAPAPVSFYIRASGLRADSDIRMWHAIGFWIPQDVSTAPNCFDVIITVGGFAELLAELTDENVDDFQLWLIHSTVELVKKHLFRQGGALPQGQ